MRQQRTCRHCSAQLPGKLVHAQGNLIVIVVRDSDRLWIEVRREHQQGDTHTEPLLFAVATPLEEIFIGGKR